MYGRLAMPCRIYGRQPTSFLSSNLQLVAMGNLQKFAIMKKTFILFILTILISVNANSQSVGALGNFIIEQNDFMTARNLLIRSGFTLFSNNELKLFGHNPSIKIIGTRGENTSNSIMANITATSQEGGNIKMAVFICSESYAAYLDADLSKVGYDIVGSREYVEAKKNNISEVTYQRIAGDYIDTVVIKYGESEEYGGVGPAEATFKRKLNK